MLGIQYLNISEGDIQGNLKQAVGYFMRSFEAYKMLKDFKNCAINKRNLGFAYKDLYFNEKKEEYLKSSIESFKESLNFYAKAKYFEEYEGINNELEELKRGYNLLISIVPICIY